MRSVRVANANKSASLYIKVIVFKLSIVSENQGYNLRAIVDSFAARTLLKLFLRGRAHAAITDDFSTL